MKFSKEEQNLFIINAIGLLLCATAHMLPSGLNFLAAVIGFLLMGYYFVESYKIIKAKKDKTEESKEE